MLRLFKKKKKSIFEMPISEAIIECKKQGAKNFSITLYIEDQILFKVMLANLFKNKGLKLRSAQDMAVVHFFNKNKTLTINAWEKFKIEKIQNKYLFYEEPKGVFLYIKNIGNDPISIEKAIHNEMMQYELTNESKISIEYTG